jgi:uncharacterized integral membrane protein (TIGR00698 family)
MIKNQKIEGVLILLCFLFCLIPFVQAPIALVLGIVLSTVSGGNFRKQVSQTSAQLLRLSVIGLGFGLNIKMIAELGTKSLFITALAVFGILLLGIILGKFLKNDTKISLLISSGTAICGGSAIAAVSTAIRAETKQISISSGVVFLLNAMALLIFPLVGQSLGLTQIQFGTWAAIAIHDTSSVVGAASKYGDEALLLATTTKLIRVLWIIPVAILTALPYWQRGTKIKYPYFIIFFVLASLVHSYLDGFDILFELGYVFAKRLLVATLFLIGMGLSLQDIKNVGWKPLAQGSILWFITSIVSLFFIMKFM